MHALLAEPSEQIFGIKQSRIRPYTRQDNVQAAVTFELDADLHLITNAHSYPIFGYFADIGGLMVVLYFIFQGIVVLFNY